MGGVYPGPQWEVLSLGPRSRQKEPFPSHKVQARLHKVGRGQRETCISSLVQPIFIHCVVCVGYYARSQGRGKEVMAMTMMMIVDGDDGEGT